MANYSSLLATINAAIRQNGTGAITGQLLQSVLGAMVGSLGAGFQYMGIATPTTNPGTPDQNVFYIASSSGAYSNFGGLSVSDGEVAILKYNGTWTKEVTGAATAKALLLSGATLTSVDLSQYTPTYYHLSDTTGEWITASSRHIVIPVKPGQHYFIQAKDELETNFAVLATYTAPSSSSTPPVSTYADGASLPILLGAGQYAVIDIPDGGNYLYIYTGRYGALRERQPDISSLAYFKEEVRDTLSSAFEHIESIEDKFQWGLVGLLYKYRLNVISNGTLAQRTSGSACCYYTKCEKGDFFKIESLSDECKCYFTADTPTAGASVVDLLGIPSGTKKYIVAPLSGYICMERVYVNSSYLYKPIDLPIQYGRKLLDIQWSAGAAIQCTPGASDYGQEISISTSWLLSEYIDISKFSVLLLYQFYSVLGASFTSGSRVLGSMFYDEDKQPLSSFAELTRTGSTRSTYTTITIPETAKFARICTHSSDAEKTIFGCAIDNGNMDISEYLQGAAKELSEKTIFEMNPDTEMLPKLMMSRKRYYDAGPGHDVGPLDFTFAHISDVHGITSGTTQQGRVPYQRFVEFATHWKELGYVQELIDTGDMSGNNYNTDMEWMNAIPGVENILVVLGNHDANDTEANIEADGYSNPTVQQMVQYHTCISINPSKRQDAFNKYFIGPNPTSPRYLNWGVILPENAAANGYCYYYKDYDRSSTAGGVTYNGKIRLIGVDAIGYDLTQENWIKGVLSDARTNGYHVLMVIHYRPGLTTRIDCDYSTLNHTNPSSSEIPASMTTMNEAIFGLGDSGTVGLAEIVDVFQGEGGVFVGYFTGHYHRDLVGYLYSYPKQLTFSVSCGGGQKSVDFTKNINGKVYDDFQFVSIDMNRKLVRLIKVGADLDIYMRKKGTVCVSYEIITDGGVDKARGFIGQGF